MTAPGDQYQRDRRVQPPAYAPDFKISVARSPRLPLISLQASVSEITGPTFGHGDIDPGDNDLPTNYAQPGQSPIGERILLHGRVLDANARPVLHKLVEVWQANAGGRYCHKKDSHPTPIDPSFGGC